MMILEFGEFSKAIRRIENIHKRKERVIEVSYDEISI